MNLLAPVSSIMSTQLVTVNPKDSFELIKEKFEQNRIHHLPVVRHKEIVGIISKADIIYFQPWYKNAADKASKDALNLKKYCAEDFMTTGLGKVESTDHIFTVVEVFKENLFHALPVVDNNELVGIVTTYDLVKILAAEKPFEK